MKTLSVPVPVTIEKYGDAREIPIRLAVWVGTASEGGHKFDVSVSGGIIILLGKTFHAEIDATEAIKAAVEEMVKP